MTTHIAGLDIYGIGQYSDLNSFLGEGWHMRALNERLDFCYVNLGTVKFYLHERKPLLEFNASGARKFQYGGPSLFRFIRMDGVRRHWSDISELK